MALEQLLLFDIDGTLLSIAEREMNVFSLALEEVFGPVDSHEDYSYAGKTDDQITFELVSRTGRSEREIEALLPEMKSRYFVMLEAMLDKSSVEILPGVVELLDGLCDEPGVLLGLQTGNWETAAAIKLARFDLDRYFDLGAYGDGHLDRRGLPPRAHAEAQEHSGYSIHPRDVVIIGDTELDVASARACGMASVGVATGSFNRAQLEAAGADLVVANLGELEAATILELTRPGRPGNG